MSYGTFTARDLTGTPIEPHTSIFPILKTTGLDEARFIGTGFFITMLGHFVTARHVIHDVIDERTGMPTASLHALHFVESSQMLVRNITRVCLHPTSDLAVGKMDYHMITETGAMLTNRVPRFTTEIPRVGSTVGTFAYPESDRLFRRGGGDRFVAGFYKGEMVDHSDKARDRNLVAWPHFTTSISLKGGSSGGPVFDESGRVFGINCVGGLPGISYMARVRELLSLSVPEWPGAPDLQDFSVQDLAKAGHIIFNPALT
jgi:hypothetical protein